MDKDQQIAEDLIGRQIDLFRFSAGERQSVLRILKLMEENLVELLFYSGRKLTETSRADKAKLLAQAQEIIEQFYGNQAAHMDRTLGELSRVEAAATAHSLGEAFASAITPALPTEGYFKVLVRDTLIQGAPSADWWKRQAGDTTFRFKSAVQQGLAQGETNDQLIRRLRGGVMDVSRANAASLVATSVQTIAAEARDAVYKANEDVIKGYRQLSTLDGHTTVVCVAYSGKEWDLKREPINGNTFPFVSPGGSKSGCPRHWACRSLITVMTKTFKELGLNIPEFVPSTRAASGGPVAGSMTFTQFIDKKGKAFADDLLGPGRAELFRDKKITLSQLLDQSGRPLTLEQLRAKYA